MAKTMREEGLGRVVSVPSIRTQSPPPQAPAARQLQVGHREHLHLSVQDDQTKETNRLDFPGPGFLSSLVLPGTSPPMPGALQNTF